MSDLRGTFGHEATLHSDLAALALKWMIAARGVNLRESGLTLGATNNFRASSWESRVVKEVWVFLGKNQ